MPSAEASVVVGTLADIYMTSGLTTDEDGNYQGFVTISAQDTAGNIFTGQADPDEIRSMALKWLESAEAADQDRIVMTMLTRDLDIPAQHAAGFIRQMREEREPNETNENVEAALGKHYEKAEEDGQGTQQEGHEQADPVDPAQDPTDGGDHPRDEADPEEGGRGGE
jgi:hypothetical protein